MSQTATPELKGTTGTPDKVPVLDVNENPDPDTAPLEEKVLDTEPVNAENTSSSDTDDDDNESELKFSRKNVEALGNNVRLVDQDEENGLDLFCYVKCSNTDSDLLKQCRGVVFNGDKLVMKAFPYTAEYNHTELSRLEEVFGTNFSKYSFYDAYEGALVRMFHFNDKWYVSTHRKLNAFRSKWASRESFGTQFKKALSAEIEESPALRNALPDGDNVLDRFQTILDKDKQYMFLILNGEDNRIVCTPPHRPSLFHVGTFVDGELAMDEDINLPHPDKHHWLNIDELINHVANIDYQYTQGVICFGPDGSQLKVFHQEYQDLFRARGNEPSIKFRYLQVRMNRKFTNMLYYLYPNQAEVFDDYENTLYDIARSIYRAYVQRFIKKRYVTVPREEFQVVKECHTWHLADRTENRISQEQVIHVLNKQSPTNLNHMIRRFKTEQAKKKEQQDELRPPRSYRKGSDTQESPALPAGSGTPTLSPLLLPRKGRNLPPPPVLDIAQEE